jgi:hypothetical protein
VQNSRPASAASGAAEAGARHSGGTHLHTSPLSTSDSGPKSLNDKRSTSNAVSTSRREAARLDAGEEKPFCSSLRPWSSGAVAVMAQCM